MVDELKRWAETTEFPDPIRWGDVESRIMLAPGPTPDEAEQLERLFPKRGSARQGLRWLTVGLLILPALIFALPAVVGLCFVLAYVLFDAEVSPDLEIVPQLVFGAAIITALFPIAECLSTRRRDGFVAMTVTLTVVASAASAILLSTTEPYTPSVWPLVQLMAIIAAVGGLVTLAIMFTLGKPTPRTRLSERFRTVPAEEQWVRAQRAVVLEQLRKRKILNDADSTALAQLPIGTWHECESLPDGRIVRHL